MTCQLKTLLLVFFCPCIINVVNYVAVKHRPDCLWSVEVVTVGIHSDSNPLECWKKTGEIKYSLSHLNRQWLESHQLFRCVCREEEYSLKSREKHIPTLFIFWGISMSELNAGCGWYKIQLMIEYVIIYIIVDWLCIRITQFDHRNSLISLEVIISSFLLITKSFAVASGRNIHKVLRVNYWVFISFSRVSTNYCCEHAL